MTSHLRAAVIASSLLAALPVAAQTLPPTQVPITPTQTYLMAFHACEGSACSNPRNHTVYLAESVDGGSWSLVPGWIPYSGSVPDVIRRDQVLYVFTASPLLTRYDFSTQTLDRVLMTVEGLPGGSASNWVDPSLFIDEENRLVLFMLHTTPGGGDPARCATGTTLCIKQFLSATEVPGSNGTRFVVDSGDRATVTLTAAAGPQSASDPDVFFDGRQYVMYISHGPSISVWTSPTLRGSYTKSTTLPQGLLSDQKGGVPAGHYDTPTAHYWTYAHVGERGQSVIRRAGHPDFNQPIADASWATVLTGPAVGLSATTSVESPGFTTRTPPRAAAQCATLNAPTPLIPIVVGSTVDLVWGGVGGATGYVIEMDSPDGGQPAFVMTADVTVASLTVSAPGTYTFRIRSRDACGTGAASAVIRATVR